MNCPICNTITDLPKKSDITYTKSIKCIGCEWFHNFICMGSVLYISTSYAFKFNNNSYYINRYSVNQTDGLNFALYKGIRGEGQNEFLHEFSHAPSKKEAIRIIDLMTFI